MSDRELTVAFGGITPAATVQMDLRKVMLGVRRLLNYYCLTNSYKISATHIVSSLNFSVHESLGV